MSESSLPVVLFIYYNFLICLFHWSFVSGTPPPLFTPTGLDDFLETPQRNLGYRENYNLLNLEGKSPKGELKNKIMVFESSKYIFLSKNLYISTKFLDVKTISKNMLTLQIEKLPLTP